MLGTPARWRRAAWKWADRQEWCTKKSSKGYIEFCPFVSSAMKVASRAVAPIAPMPTTAHKTAQSIWRLKAPSKSGARRPESHSAPAKAHTTDTHVETRLPAPSPPRTAYRSAAATPAGTSATPKRSKRRVEGLATEVASQGV